jgi:hypothetical protein
MNNVLMEHTVTQNILDRCVREGVNSTFSVASLLPAKWGATNIHKEAL